VCDLENLVNEEALAHWGLLRTKRKKLYDDAPNCEVDRPILSVIKVEFTLEQTTKAQR
jgi:hypothetical protein